MWTPVGNIKGAPGDPATLPDPLVVDELYIGAKARFVALPNGMKLEVMDSGGVWRIQAQWTET
jgi:hypothetical protein